MKGWIKFFLIVAAIWIIAGFVSAIISENAGSSVLISVFVYTSIAMAVIGIFVFMIQVMLYTPGGRYMPPPMSVQIADLENFEKDHRRIYLIKKVLFKGGLLLIGTGFIGLAIAILLGYLFGFQL